MSNSKINARIESLTAIENRTKSQSIYLASASCKIDNKTASQRFNQISKSPFLAEILGDCPMPSYNEFCAQLPAKQDDIKLYSEVDAFRVLGRIAKAFDKAAAAAALVVEVKKTLEKAAKATKPVAVKVKVKAAKQQANTDKK